MYGTLPPELGGLKQLDTLVLQRNRLTGIVPGEYGKLSNLYWLDLSLNMLEGPIPSELAKCKTLKFMCAPSVRSRVECCPHDGGGGVVLHEDFSPFYPVSPSPPSPDAISFP